MSAVAPVWLLIMALLYQADFLLSMTRTFFRISVHPTQIRAAAPVQIDRPCAFAQFILCAAKCASCAEAHFSASGHRKSPALQKVCRTGLFKGIPRKALRRALWGAALGRSRKKEQVCPGHICSLPYCVCFAVPLSDRIPPVDRLNSSSAASQPA